MRDTDTLILACVFVACWHAAAHYLPWQSFLRGKHVKDYPPAAYALGCVGVTIAFYKAEAWGVLGLIAIFLASGAAVLACYALDVVMGWRNLAAAREALDQEMNREVRP